MGPRSTRWGTGIWFLLCTGLAGGVALELLLPLAPQVTAARPAAPLPEFAPEPKGFEPPPRHVFAEIVARPLFSASRRPFAGESEAAKEQPAGESVAIELVGTLLTERGAAALLQPQGQIARWFHAGDTVAGWEVKAIQREQVSLRLDGEDKILALRADLAQAVQPTKKAERRRAENSAQPGDQAQTQEQKPDIADRAQNQGEEPDPTQGGEVEQVEPSSD